MVLITDPCTMSWTSIHSSSGTLSDLIPWIYLSTPLYNHKGIWFRSYLNDMVVFPTFFNLSLNLAIRSSCPEPQFAPALVFADFPIFGCKEYDQSDFSVGHMVMSTCRVFSWVVGRGCLLWLVHSLDKTLISHCPASFSIPRPNLPVTPGVSWLPTFAFQSPIMKRTSFGGVSSQRSCMSS